MIPFRHFFVLKTLRQRFEHKVLDKEKFTVIGFGMYTSKSQSLIVIGLPGFHNT
jgi:hypothetical protein